MKGWVHTVWFMAAMAFLATVWPGLGAAAEPQEGPPCESRPRVVSAPSLSTVMLRMDAANLPDGMALLHVGLGEKGNVVSSRIVRGTGSAKVDAALAYWARGVVFSGTCSGEGLLPVRLRADDNGWQPLPPLSDAVATVAREAGMPRVAGALTFRDSAFGAWTPRIHTSSGNPAVDAAILAWARSLPVELLGPGMAVYPFDESTAPDDRAMIERHRGDGASGWR